MANPYPTLSPTPTGSSSSSPDAKRRRLQDSSSEGSELDITPVPGRSFSAERYRVGIPALALLPLHGISLPSDSSARARFREFEPEINQILQQKKIDFEEHETDVVYRTISGDRPSEDDATLIIFADWVNDNGAQSWYDAANEIKNVLIRAAHTRSLKVEIIGWQLIKPRVASVVELSHPLVSAWPMVNPRIHEVIGKFQKVKSGWQSIDVLRIGYESHASRPVIISITVDYSLDRRDWYPAEKELKRMLEEFDQYDLRDVQVEFERGNVEPSMAFPMIKPTKAGDGYDIIKEVYPERVSTGLSFGPDRYFQLSPDKPVINGRSATIGGYLEIRPKGGQWKKYALTNYHCVRQAIDGHTFVEDGEGNPINGPVEPNSELEKVDQTGFGPDRKDRESMTFESPSRRKHRFTLLWHEQQLAGLEGDLKKLPNYVALQQAITRHREMKARKTDYFDQGKHLLGCLYMCSGHNQRLEKSRIDIALLEVRDNKMGNNTIPEAAQWSSSLLAPYACGRMLSGIASCKDATLGSVFKFGSRTGGTTGQLSPIKSDVKMPWDKEPHVKMDYSTEYVFVADSSFPLRLFQDHGDSGSFIFTRPGQWLGLAFGGSMKFNMTGAVAYLTDAQVVIDWISTRGNGYEVRLPQY